MQLPPALQPWAEPLSVLDAELAVALGPLVRQLDQLITRQDLGAGTHGPLDGYDGITRQGSPTRMLISEWALADAVPDEFLRRAVNAELLYLEPSYQQDRARASMAVLVDTGPDQLGAARLVQLATLIVLLRRAAARGQDLSLGVLTATPGAWLTGDPKHLLHKWLTSRTPTDPSPTAVAAWTTAPAEETDTNFDEVWVLAGSRLAKALPGTRRVLVTRECAWDEAGATAAEVRLAGDRVELALPRHDLGIRALRGAALRPAAGSSGVPTGARFGTFTGSPRRLIARGNESDELVALTLTGNPKTRPKQYKLPGPVLAAGCFSRRTMALFLQDGHLQIRSFGKTLGRLNQLSVPLSDLELTDADINDLAELDLPALYFASGAVIFRLGAHWWRLFPGDPAMPADVIAVATGDKLDEPLQAERYGEDVVVSPAWARLANTERVILGRDNLVARFDGDSWWLRQVHHASDATEFALEIPTGAEPFGVLTLDNEPSVLCHTKSDGTTQLCTIDGHRTLTHLPRAHRTPSLHPFDPLLALELGDRIDVVDLSDGSLVATLRGDE
ncbi:hypothetical protein GCM10009554_51150 [Kribbella koreensis]|uniref:Uncharacterized protein n=1 Tax=Kribbella koreensis TaxID=57909 RepID=A0ABN1R1U8_9ACTN